MNELKIFENEEFGEVRTVTINNEPWFVAKDVCEALKHTNPTMAMQMLEEDERTKLSLGRAGETNVINESGLYTLIIKSNLPNAKKFRKWVTSEVLPSIRKHGIYAKDEVIDNILNDPDFGIKLLTSLKEEKQKNKFLSNQIQEKTELIEQLQPKATYYDLILQCCDLLTTTEISKDYGMSAKWFNQLLQELHIQFHQSGRWFLYAKHDGKGYTQSRTQAITHHDGSKGYTTHMYWTQKGRLFLYDTLKKQGIVPNIENQ